MLRDTGIIHSIEHFNVGVGTDAQLHLFDVFCLLLPYLLNLLNKPYPEHIIIHKLILELIEFLLLGSQGALS